MFINPFIFGDVGGLGEVLGDDLGEGILYGESDPRWTYGTSVPPIEPGTGASTLNTVVFIGNTNTGVVSPIPAGVTFTIQIEVPSRFSGTRSVTYTAPHSTGSLAAIAALIEMGNELLNEHDVYFSYVSDSSLRIRTFENFYVGRELSVWGYWILAQTIYSEGSTGLAGNPRASYIRPTEDAVFTPGETLTFTAGAYAISYIVQPGDDIEDILTGLTVAIDGSPDWYANPLSPAEGELSVMPQAGVYGTHPWVSYTVNMLSL